MVFIVILGVIILIGMTVLAWFSIHYGKKSKKVVVGSVWISDKEDKNPFNKPVTYKIEAVEKGYVLYSYRKWGTSRDTDSTSVAEFVMNHDLYEEAKEENK